MPIQYSVVERGNPSDPNAPKKFYANAKSRGDITLRELSNRIAQISTVSTTDTLAVLEALLQVVPEELIHGNIVRLGDFGSFSVRVSSEGQENAEDVNASAIKQVRLHFNEGKEFKKVLKTAEYQKVAEPNNEPA